MNVGGNPGFFYGHYGGPRTNTTAEIKPKYNFTKPKNEKLNSLSSNEAGPSGAATSLEPLNEAILEGCANLLDQTGKRVQVILRDGKILIGELASVDHFSNILLRDAVERIVVGNRFGDITRGIFIIRGDNLVLIGEVDGENEAVMEQVLKQVPVNEILLEQKLLQEAEYAKQLKYNEALKLRGVSFPRPLEDEF